MQGWLFPGMLSDDDGRRQASSVDMRDEVIDDLLDTHMPQGSYAEQWDSQGLYAAVIDQLGVDVPVIDWCEEDGVDDEQIRERLIEASDKLMAEKLEAFGKARAEADGIEATTRSYSCHDLTTDLDNTLLGAVDDVGADLVVMASHIPDIVDYVWPSNGGKVAEHSKASVFVVR